MAAGAHFGCPKLHFWPFQIDTQLFVLEIFWHNGSRRPFWMSENHFRLHFWPFQIDMQLYFFWNFFTKWLLSAILDVRNSLSIAFLVILDQYTILFDFGIFYKMATGGHLGCSKITFDGISGHFRSIRILIIYFNFWQNGRRRPFWMSENHFQSHLGCSKITFDGISGHFRSIRILIIYFNFWQNGRRRPFWMSENHFQSHFWPQIFFWQNGHRRPFWMGRLAMMLTTYQNMLSKHPKANLK